MKFLNYFFLFFVIFNCGSNNSHSGKKDTDFLHGILGLALIAGGIYFIYRHYQNAKRYKEYIKRYYLSYIAQNPHSKINRIVLDKFINELLNEIGSFANGCDSFYFTGIRKSQKAIINYVVNFFSDAEALGECSNYSRFDRELIDEKLCFIKGLGLDEDCLRFGFDLFSEDIKEEIRYMIQNEDTWNNALDTMRRKKMQYMENMSKSMEDLNYQLYSLKNEIRDIKNNKNR